MGRNYKSKSIVGLVDTNDGILNMVYHGNFIKNKFVKDFIQKNYGDEN